MANETRVTADRRRRSEVLRTYLRLDDLHSALIEKRFTISRSVTHLKLMPKRSSSTEGKRHIETVPVRLCKPQNDAYTKHEDADFCFSLANDLTFIASILGSEETIFISRDDKGYCQAWYHCCKAANSYGHALILSCQVAQS